jgi:hypothetical protein
MSLFTKTAAASAMCAAMAIMALPASAGVMTVVDKANLGATSPTEQVDWRPYCHRHYYRGWRSGYAAPTYYGYSAPAYYGFSAPVVSGGTVAADGNYCATSVKTCLLYEPGWLGTGCSCRVPGGIARGTVIQ